jgi:diguanylate cyclase (GGDEF)-like protein
MVGDGAADEGLTLEAQPAGGRRTGRRKRFASPHAARSTREAGTRATELDSILAFMAGELGADAALLSIQDHGLDEARLCSAWGQWRRLESAAKLTADEPDWAAHSDESPIADVLVAPVRSPSGRTGSVAVGFVFGLDEHRRLAFDALESYAVLFGLWLDDAGALQRLVRAAYRDALTGCLSYGALMHELDREVSRVARTGGPLTCLFVDVDGFKEVNDAAGHQAANRMLVDWAQKVMDRVRETDILGRFGGDEFILVLPDTDAEGAAALAEALEVEIVKEPSDPLEAPLTSSIGIGEWRPGMSPSDLIEAADEAMQAARAWRATVG